MSGYIGTQPVPQATQSREVFTATSGQTTFATVGYPVGFVDVWLNGVKLINGTDFTATNGSDVVLAVGATTGDTVEVISNSTFEVNNQTFTGDTSAENFTVTGAFTSRGIDDNATSTAVTLDASGNVLVGKTTADNTTVGTTIYGGSSASMSIVRSGASQLILNRLSTDGDMAVFRKDGTTVGSIGTINGSVSLNGPSGVRLYDTVDGGIVIASSKIYPANASGSTNDGVITLGSATTRFKDLYLSGGVYLGGTGGANLLDDYEQGTFTPYADFAATSPTAGATAGTGYYVKVGNMVTVWMGAANINVTGSAGDFRFTGLPFTIASDTVTGQASMPGTARANVLTLAANCYGIVAEFPDNTAYVRIAEMLDGASSDYLTGGNCTHGQTDLFVQITYPVA